MPKTMVRECYRSLRTASVLAGEPRFVTFVFCFAFGARFGTWDIAAPFRLSTKLQNSFAE